MCWLRIRSVLASLAWRISLASALSLCVSMAPAQVPPAPLQACRNETDNALRLQCYDREVGKLSLTPTQSFGLNDAQVKAAQHQPPIATTESQKLSATVTAIRLGQSGKFIATLDNGQVWAQIEAEGVGIDVGDAVTIKPGLLGSYLLIDRHHWSSKVHRLR